MAVEEDNEQERETAENNNNNNNNNVVAECVSRKEKRNLLKKLKRKQLRRETAIKEREIEEAVSNDPEVQMRLLQLEQEEAEQMERDRREFEERERLFVLGLELKKKREEEGEIRKHNEEESNRDLVTNGDEQELNEGDDWEYVEEGPAEIIWKGNEIIVKKKKVKVPKNIPDLQMEKQECERPISNPLAPQSEVFKDYKSAQQVLKSVVLKSVAQQVPNFGTEQDKAHCPFHLKTGVCRFGARCSRAHFYPDKSCTLLFKNMYSGPGLAWEQDEGLEYTDDNAERSFEEFYEDVHTEFLKFGELVNFKVCKNASSHLRGNVYVHYKFLESAMFAYQSINGRYFAGKQMEDLNVRPYCRENWENHRAHFKITGEFVNLTKWKVAICGEYMKSRLKTCSRGSVCNFIHCFRNPGGDYEWADWDKPAPRYWLKEMGALFGYTDDRFKDENLRSRSRGPGSPHRKTHSDEDDDHRRRYLERHKGDYEENISSFGHYRTKRKRSDSVDGSDCSSEEQKSRQNSNSKRERHLKLERQVRMNREHRANASDTESRKREAVDRSLERKSRTSSWQKHDFESVHEYHRCEKSNQFDLKKSPHVERHLRKYRNHESEDSLQKTKEAFSSDNVSARDSLVKDKNTRHNAKSLHMKDEGYLSDNNSNGNRFGADVRPPKSRRNISTSNSKSEYRECNSKSDSLERVEDNKCRNHGNSSRAMKNISNSALDGGRIETDGKRPQRNRRKSKRSENQADFMDSESERLKERSDGRRRRSTKRSIQVNHEAESSDIGSDGGTPRRYEEKPKKDRRIRLSSKNDLDFLDVQSSLRSLNGEERHNGYGERNNMLHMEHGLSFKPPGDCEKSEEKVQADVSTHRRDKRTSDVALGRSLSEQDKIVDANCRSGAQSGRPLTNPELQDPSPSRCSAESHDSYLGGLESTRDKKCNDTDKEHTPPINKSNVETTTSQRVEAYFSNSSCHSLDGEAEAGLKQTYCMAALQKLEEMRRCKDTLSVQSRKLNISVETHSHENINC